MPLFLQDVKMIKANKFFLPISVWENLSKDDKDNIKNLFIQKVHNPFDCFLNQQNRIKCKQKQALEDKGRKGIAACFKCSKCESTLSAMSRSTDYISFERFNRNANYRLRDILQNAGYKIHIENRTVFPKINEWHIDTTKMDIHRATEQRRIADLWLHEKNGVLVLPPRSGKSILTAFVAEKLQTRVLILVHKIELARQFLKDYTTFTTIKRIEINPKVLDDIDVAICTYQQFISKYGLERIKEFRKQFGLVVVDEIHKAASPTFHKVINSFYAKYRLGVTATPKRRDAKEFLNDFTFGPVLVKGGTEQLTCDYTITHTNWEGTNPTTHRGWDGLWQRLANSKERNSFISKCAIHDVEKGYKLLLPVKRHKQMTLLYKLITRKAKKNGLLLNVCMYHGKLNKTYRKELQKDISDGKYDIVIGSDQILSLGFNAPPMSCIYINLHTYRTFEEDLYQEFSRVRTAYRKKNKPLIRIFNDISQVSEKSIQEIEKVMNKYNFDYVEDTYSKKQEIKRSQKGLRILF